MTIAAWLRDSHISRTADFPFRISSASFTVSLWSSVAFENGFPALLQTFILRQEQEYRSCIYCRRCLPEDGPGAQKAEQSHKPLELSIDVLGCDLFQTGLPLIRAMLEQACWELNDVGVLKAELPPRRCWQPAEASGRYLGYKNSLRTCSRNGFGPGWRASLCPGCTMLLGSWLLAIPLCRWRSSVMALTAAMNSSMSLSTPA